MRNPKTLAELQALVDEANGDRQAHADLEQWWRTIPTHPRAIMREALVKLSRAKART